MGGAAGHMAHPFDLPFVKTGSDLVNFFEAAADILSAESMSVKIDGVNVSFKVVGDEDNKQFAVDRGSTKPIDIEGVTIARVGERFPEGHGMLSAVSALLTILNASIKDVKPELQELGMWDNPSIFLNTEYVVGTTNVTQYDQNFLAIHGVNEFYQKTNQRTGVTRPGTKRPEGATGPSIEVGYDPAVLERFAEKLRPAAAERNFEVFTSVPTSKIEEVDINFSSTLNEPLTIVFNEEDEITKSLGEWLRESQNPKGIDIKIQDPPGGDKLKKIAALSKQVYLNILNGTPITSFIPNKEDVQPAIEAAVFYHATRQLGNDVLKALTSPMGDVMSHEGVVIRHKSFGPNPVKITGEFIVGGMVSGFRESLADSLREFSINDNPGYSVSTPKKYVVLIPGGFKPPHKGHYSMIENYAKMPNVEAVVIISGDKPREGVTKEMSRQLFNLYGGLSNKIMFIDDNLPLRAAFEKLGEEEFVNQFSTEVIYTLGCSDKDGDEARAANFAKWFVKNPDKNILNVNVGALGACPAEASDVGTLSASSMRKAARDGDDETLRAHVPDGVDLNAVKSILVKAIEEVRESFSLPFLDALVEEVMDEIRLKKSKSKKKEEEEELEEMSTAGGSAGSNGSVEGPPRREMGKRDSGTMIRQ